MNFVNKDVQEVVKDVKVFGDLFINSFSEVKTQKQRKDDKVSVDYYQMELLSLENMSVSGTRMVSQNHNSEGTESKWKDLSPSTVKALQVRATITGELSTLPGYKIAKLTYNKSYDIAGKEIFLDTVVFSEEKGLESVLLKRLQSVGLIKREVAEVAEA